MARSPTQVFWLHDDAGVLSIDHVSGAREGDPSIVGTQVREGSIGVVVVVLEVEDVCRPEDGLDVVADPRVELEGSEAQRRGVEDVFEIDGLNVGDLVAIYAGQVKDLVAQLCCDFEELANFLLVLHDSGGLKSAWHET